MRRTAFFIFPMAWLLAAGCSESDVSASHRPTFTISKDTTYVIGPLDEDGYVDYAAALNERNSQAVKPDDNANVLLWQALGPQPEDTTMPAAFFQRMGMPVPHERGDYFIQLKKYISEHVGRDAR
jgi:hypothetical protein